MMDTRPSSTLQTPLLRCTYTRSALPLPQCQGQSAPGTAFPGWMHPRGLHGPGLLSAEQYCPLPPREKELWPSGGVTFLGAPVTSCWEVGWGAVVAGRERDTIAVEEILSFKGR